MWADGRRHTPPGRREAEDALDALVVSLRTGTDQLTVAGLLDRYKAARSGDWSP